MTDRDLTPAEARAEVEAFMGEGWRVDVSRLWANDYRITAIRSGTSLIGCGCSYLAAVSALKQAWRDAVRPWMEAAIDAKLDTADVDGYSPNERVIVRVCEKGMENA